jgi:hydroxyacylglutathione hydrolase
MRIRRAVAAEAGIADEFRILSQALQSEARVVGYCPAHKGPPPGMRAMAELEIHQFPCLSDNYGVLIHDSATNAVASIDAPEASAVRKALAEKGWRLTHVLATHHHADHTDGILPLKSETRCSVIGPRNEAAKIPGLDRPVGEGDTFPFGSFPVHVLDTPGHTAGHITYWIPAASVAFAGDTLFAMGCGRVLEGTAETMWRSLEKLMALPPSTRVYCGHEYTLANAKFGVTIEPENEALQRRCREVEALRATSQPTLPTRMDLELATNVFLRPDSLAIRQRLGMMGEPAWKVFGEIRERKNRG